MQYYMLDIVIGAIVFGLIGFAVFYVVKNRKKPCAGCPYCNKCEDKTGSCGR